MAGPFPTPSFRVPGVLDDDALQQQLKLYADQQNRVDGQGPSPAALGMADKIQQSYIDRPLSKALKLTSALAPAPLGPAMQAVSTIATAGGGREQQVDPQQQQAIDVRSDILSNNGIGGAVGRTIMGPLATILSDASPLVRWNRLSSEDAQVDADQRVEAAKNAENAVKADAEARQRLRHMSDEEAAQLGLPIAPGGTDPQTDEEQAERRAKFDAARVKEAEEATTEAEGVVATPEAQAQLPWWLNMAREATRGLERIPTSSLKTIAIANEARYGFGSGRSDARAWVDTLDAAFDKMLPADKARAKDFSTQLAAGGGSMLGFLALGAIGGMAGLGTKASATIIGAATNASQQFEDAEAYHASAFAKYLTLLVGAGIGATEALPIDRMLMRAHNATGDLVTRMLHNTAAPTLDEFLQEFGQNVGNDMAKWIYDENHEIDWKGALEQGVIGGITGSLAGAATSTLAESGVLPDLHTAQRGEQEQQGKRDKAAQQDTTQEQEQEAFLKRFFTQSQETLDRMRQEAEFSEQLTAVPAETAERVPSETVEAETPETITPDQIVERLQREGPRPVTQVAEDYAAALPRPQLFEPSTERGIGGAVPRTTAEGNIVLRHQARSVRTELDPDAMGTGPVKDLAQARLVGPNAVGRTYYGVESGPDLQQPAVPLDEYIKLTREETKAARKLGLDRRRVEQALERRWFEERDVGSGYMGEGLGPYTHEVTVGRDDLYNMNEDPLNLRAQLPDDLTGPERHTLYEKLIKDAGFRGAYYPRSGSGLGRTAILFTKETPSRVVDDRYGLPVSEIATPEDFRDPTPEAFRKGGWAVITGTQEAQGAYTSTENVAANNKLREQLRRDGVQFEEVSGAYKGEPQGTSFLIFAPESYALKLGKTFKQESILTRDGLVYSDGSDRLVPARGVVIGDEARGSDFFSTLPDGTDFSVNLDFDAEGKRGELAMATPSGSGGGTASARGPLRGEQRRPRRGIAGGTDAVADEISLSKIAQNVIDLMNLTARQGRFTLKGSNVVGQYSARQNVVRMKTWNDLSTLVHEGAHALEQAASPALRQWIDGNKAGLEKVAKALYGGDVSKMPPKEVVSEGFAEFFRVYTLNRGFTTIKYPTLTQDFHDLLTRTDPQLGAGLDAIGDQFAAWLQLPSAQLVRNMVVSGRQTTGINAAVQELQEKGFGNWFHEVVTNTLTDTTNRYAKLNDLVGQVLNVGERNQGQALDIKRAEDPRVLIRLAANAGNRAMVQTTDGVMPYRDVNPSTQGLRAALLRYHGLGEDDHLAQIDPNRQRDFAAYTVALRGIDEYRRLAEGKIDRPPLNATLGDLRLTVKEMNDRYGNDFAEAAKIVHEYGMALWKKSFDAGLMTKQTYTDGLDRQFYVPLQRDMSDKDVSTSDIADAMATGKGRSIVKRFRGSDRDVIDPIDALMQKTFSLERVIVENDIKKALAHLADKAGKAGALVERVPAHRLLGQEYSVQEIARQLTKDDTVTETDAQDLMTILEASIEEGNRIALFRSQQAVAGGDNILFFWEGGKLAAIQLKDGDLGADVVNTMNGIGRENMPAFLGTIASASTAFRASITSWPDFLLVNFIRDQASAFVLTDVGYKPFVTGLRGVGDEVRQNDWARQYNAAMGIMGGMNTAALHKARVERDIAALKDKGYRARAFADGKISGLANVVELTETGSRLGIFRSAYERAKKDGLTDWEASIEASYLATDYIDFGLNGSRMLVLRRTIPFLNAQLQGFYKLMRTLGGDEVRQRKGLNFALRAYFKDINSLDLSRTEKQALQTGRKAWIKMMSLGFIGAALTLAFRDDPDYQDASEYLRATGWVIPMGDGRIFYIPKPFELAVFSNFVERGIEFASGDGNAPAHFLRGMAMNLSPPTSPPAIQAVVEQLANYDFFTGREIVPDYMRALAPELQYNNYTSDFAKKVGAVLGMSPLRVDHLLAGFGASAYRDLTWAYNSVLGEGRPSSDVTNWPITRRFVRDARRGSQSAADFWSYASTVNGTLRSAEVTYKTLMEGGQERAAEDFLNTLDPDARAYALLNVHFKADAKRLNPFYRVRQLGTIVSAMRRELSSTLGVEDSTTKFSEPVKLSAEEKYKIDQLLSEYMRREMRNTLIYMQDPGWRGKTPLPTDTTMDLLGKTNPFVFDEINRRIRKAKVYSGETVQEYWPETRDRLLSDREAAFLKDLTTIAKVMR